MEARIDHVVDVRDTRPAFGITYRKYTDTRSSHIRIQADDFDHAMQALTKYVGNTQFAVLAVYKEVPQVPQARTPEASQETDSKGQRIIVAKGKRYVVSAIIPAVRVAAKAYVSRPHVNYWTERNGETFGATRTAGPTDKPGTVGRAVWDAAQ